MLQVLLCGVHCPKNADSMGQAKVINSRLIEERSETFNVSSIINAFEKV